MLLSGSARLVRPGRYKPPNQFPEKDLPTAEITPRARNDRGISGLTFGVMGHTLIVQHETLPPLVPQFARIPVVASCLSQDVPYVRVMGPVRIATTYPEPPLRGTAYPEPTERRSSSAVTDPGC